MLIFSAPILTLGIFNSLFLPDLRGYPALHCAVDVFERVICPLLILWILKASCGVTWNDVGLVHLGRENFKDFAVYSGIAVFIFTFVNFFLSKILYVVFQVFKFYGSSGNRVGDFGSF